MKKSNSDQSLMMSLGLYLLILCFFIVLNTHSEFKKEKQIPVLASLDASFASSIYGTKTNTAERPVTSKKPGLFEGSLINDVEIALRNSLNIISSQRSDKGRVLSVVLKKEIFFASFAKPNSLGFMDVEAKLKALLNNETQNYKMTLVLSAPDLNSPALQQEWENVEEILQRIDLDRSQYEVRFKKGPADLIHLEFEPQNRGL